MGTGISYLLASALFRLGHPPVILGSAAMLWGYFRSMLARTPRYGDAEFRRFVRRYQWRCLLQGKNRATRAINERQAPRWRPPAPVESCSPPASLHTRAAAGT
jgi:poly-beta-1,6-N-acetyl-D-glucosamine synthase